MGNADGLDGLQSRPHKGIPLFSPEGIPFGICLWSWFMWNRGPSGLGDAAVPLCQPTVPFYRWGA